MADIFVRPLVSLFAKVTLNHRDALWRRVRMYGAHHDAEVCRLWARIEDEGNRVERDLNVLWQRLADFGATEDAELRRLWRLIAE